ncbi:MAG: amino acid ABC transporter substrate-binding protein [Cyanobacterium sp. T60_A2020_053]|nr:amino acid ABC transporter substrate-binding protein [Cyanobacterium sp. T60_A2020_053]
MWKKLIILALSFSVVNIFPSSVLAQEVLEQVKETGIMKAGYRLDTPPFAFVNEEGKPVGYAIEILDLIREELETQLGQKITLQLVPINPQNRFQEVIDGSIYIECGSTTVTWEREKTVDFSVSYFASGTQMITKKGSGFANSDNLKGANIAVIPQTTNEKAITRYATAANLIPVASEEEGWQKLVKGEIDGFAGDGILLQSLRKQAPSPQDYEIVPEFPYVIESYACTLPPNQSQWRDTVNYTLVKFMQGVTTDTPSAIAIYERWFGANGNTPYPIETMADYFQGIVHGFEWIPIDERY